MQILRKTFYIILTFIICLLLKNGRIWLGFAPMFLVFISFRFNINILWEIPLAVLFAGTLFLAFPDDIKLFIYVLLPVAAMLISVINPKKLFLFFASAVPVLIFKNIYSAAVLWAAIWYSGHTALFYFITKNSVLQDYKK